jgi:hypothetical protein
MLEKAAAPSGSREDYDFVILGPGSTPRHKLCRLEMLGHILKCGSRFCSHGLEQEYSHAHLKKYGVLVEE